MTVVAVEYLDVDTRLDQVAGKLLAPHAVEVVGNSEWSDGCSPRGIRFRMGEYGCAEQEEHHTGKKARIPLVYLSVHVFGRLPAMKLHEDSFLPPTVHCCFVGGIQVGESYAQEIALHAEERTQDRPRDQGRQQSPKAHRAKSSTIKRAAVDFLLDDLRIQKSQSVALMFL